MNLTPLLLPYSLFFHRCLPLVVVVFLISTSTQNYQVLCYTTEKGAALQDHLSNDKSAQQDIASFTSARLQQQQQQKEATNFWQDAGRLTGLILNKCLESLDGDNRHRNFAEGVQQKDDHMNRLKDCLKYRSLIVFDKILNRNVIELADGVALVRFNSSNSVNDYPARSSKAFNGQMVKDWKLYVLKRIVHIFSTHTLRIKLGSFFNDNTKMKYATQETTMGRHRRHRNMMMPLMVFGMMALGMIMIPMGFQFLAVLGGKALLLAKMALLLTSIQGLKKIATSNLNYGLYSTTGHAAAPVTAAGYPWHYDRKWPIDPWGYGLGAAGGVGSAAVGEGQDFQSSQYNYYDVVGANSRPDLLHPYQPRIATNDAALFH